MSRYSVQILICFMANVFQFYNPLWVGWELCHYGMGLLPSTIVIVIRTLRLQQQTIKPPSIPCWEVKDWISIGMITLEELPLNYENWQAKWIKTKIMSRLSIHELIEGSLFLYLWVLFTAFHYSFQSDATNFWCITFNSCQSGVWKSFLCS